MYYKLAEVLIEKKLITKDMEIEIEYDVSTLGNVNTIKTTGSFIVQNIVKNKQGTIIFYGASINDGTKLIISVPQIVGLDGMEPSRFAAVYGVAEDGSDLIMAKRRGRTPKSKNIKADD